MEFTARQIAQFLSGQVQGDENATVNTFAKIEEGRPGAISFLSNSKYTDFLYTTQSSVVLINRDFKLDRQPEVTLILVDNAYESLARLLTLYSQAVNPPRQGISPLASVSESAQIGKDVFIGPFAVIEDEAVIGDGTQIYPHAYVGRGAKIGNGCILYPNATLYYGCILGDRCTMHAGSVVGADGFGFAPTQNGYEKIPQIGIAQLEDDVEIGANTCIDRSTMGRTIVHKGVKLDNMVQIAHNVEVGENTVMSAQSGIAGSTKIGQWCMIGGQSGINGHIKVGNKVNLGAKTGLMQSTPDGQNVMGYPATGLREFLRSSVVFRKLPDMKQEIQELKKELESLKAKLEDK